MVWRGPLKGVVVTLLLLGAVIGLWYGVITMMFTGDWKALLGLLMMIAAFRAAILAFDLMWGRPPAFSKEPWNRPWEKKPPGDDL